MLYVLSESKLGFPLQSHDAGCSSSLAGLGLTRTSMRAFDPPQFAYGIYRDLPENTLLQRHASCACPRKTVGREENSDLSASPNCSLHVLTASIFRLSLLDRHASGRPVSRGFA
jgi:hypothetical protein